MSASAASASASVAVWPGGSAAAKNQVSKRRGSASGVIQRAHGGQQVGAQHQAAAGRAARPKSQLPPSSACRSASQDGAVGRPARRGGPGQQHAGLLERLPDRRADQGARPVRRSTPSRAPNSAGVGPVPGTRCSGRRPARRPIRPGTRRRPGAKSIAAGPAQQEHLDAAAGTARRTAAASRSRASRGAAGDAVRPRDLAHRRPPAAGLGRRSPAGRVRSCIRSAATSAISSTSTGASSGSTAIPTALRACLPASPNTSMQELARAVRPPAAGR